MAKISTNNKYVADAIDNLLMDAQSAESTTKRLKSSINTLQNTSDSYVQNKKKAIGVARKELKAAIEHRKEMRDGIRKAMHQKKLASYYGPGDNERKGLYSDIQYQLHVSRKYLKDLNDAIEKGERAFKEEGINPVNILDRHMKSKRGKGRMRMPKERTLTQSSLDKAMR